MNRINLNVPYQLKDQAKAVAQQNGTRINWDGKAKTWYWQGNGEMPACLDSYRHCTRESYARSTQSWNEFKSSKAGAAYRQRQDEMIAAENGYDSVEEMRKADEEFEQRRIEAAKDSDWMNIEIPKT